jgi:hypothetical protein
MPRFGRFVRGPRILRGPRIIRPFIRPPRRIIRRLLFGSFVYLAITGSRPYKLYPEEIERVEQRTGKPVEDLTEDELKTSMRDLNIENREVSDEEYNRINEQNGKLASDAKTGTFCRYCGSKLDGPNAKFCSNCGSQINS